MGIKDFPLVLRHSPASPSKLSGSIFALMLQQIKILAEISLTLDNSYSIRNLCFVNELQQTTTNFWDWGSVGQRNLPNFYQIFTDIVTIKCLNGGAYRHLGYLKKNIKNLQKFGKYGNRLSEWH
jgi:hypothetical protein